MWDIVWLSPQGHRSTNRDLCMPYSAVSFWMTLGEIFSDTKRAQLLCDSWASCSLSLTLGNINFLWYIVIHQGATRDGPKFGFGCGFGAETDFKCSFGSVTALTPHFTFDFGCNYTAADRNWPKLEWVKLMEYLQHWIRLHTLHREKNFELKP